MPRVMEYGKAFAMFLFIYCFMFPAMDVYYLYNKKVIKIKHKIVLLENYSPSTSMIPALLVIRCTQQVDSYPGKKMSPSCSFVNCLVTYLSGFTLGFSMPWRT